MHNISLSVHFYPLPNSQFGRELHVKIPILDMSLSVRNSHLKVLISPRRFSRFYSVDLLWMCKYNVCTCAVCSGDGVRIVPGNKASNGLNSQLVQRYSVNGSNEKVLQSLIRARTAHTYAQVMIIYKAQKVISPVNNSRGYPRLMLICCFLCQSCCPHTAAPNICLKVGAYGV